MRHACLCAFVAAFLHAAARAAVVTDPSLVPGVNAIDPSGSQSVDFNATGATSQAALEADAEFSAVQTFTGFVSGTTIPQNVISFTSPYWADVSFTQSGKFVTTQSGAANASSNGTSETSSIRLRVNSTTTAGSGGTLTYTIDFGSYSGGTFDGSVNAVKAAGFTLAQFGNGHTATVRFISASGTTLSTQTVTGQNTDPNGGTAGADYAFGYDSGGAFADLISKVEVDITSADANASSSDYIDDLAFTPVPAPSATATSVYLAAILACRRRRRKSHWRFGRRPQRGITRVAPVLLEPMPASYPIRLAISRAA